LPRENLAAYLLSESPDRLTRLLSRPATISPSAGSFRFDSGPLLCRFDCSENQIGSIKDSRKVAACRKRGRKVKWKGKGTSCRGCSEDFPSRKTTFTFREHFSPRSLSSSFHSSDVLPCAERHRTLKTN